MLLAVLAAAAVAADAAPATSPAPITSPAPAAAAAPAAPAAKPVVTAKTNAKSDVVCKTEQVTGSMLPKRVCYNKAEAESIRAEEQQRLRESQRSGLVSRQ